MATIPPGGIVPVPDPVTGGAGAPVMTANIVNAMWANAQAKSLAGAEWVQEAIDNADPAPQMVVPVLDKTFVPVPTPAFPSMDPNNGEAIYDAKSQEILAMLQASFDSYIAEFFPDPQYFDHAMDWCDRAITQGGSGINPAVEQALWQRGRARILGDSLRAEAEAEQVMALRRWPVPPAQLMAQQNAIRLDAGHKLAEVNRDITVKVFDTEIENVRFAIGQVINARQAALAGGLDYVRTMASGPQIAMQLATGLVGIQNDYYRSLVSYYTAQNTALEPKYRLAIADAQLKLEGEKANLASRQASVEDKVKAALQGAQLLASQASAGINAINSGASVSGSDSSQI